MLLRMFGGGRRRLGLALLGSLALAWGVGLWAVPALIVAQVGTRYRGKVTIRGWWLDRTSAGVTGLTLHEGPDAGSPVWASVPVVTTDLSFGAILRGRFTPGLVTLRSPRVMVRLDRDARPLTRIPLKGSPGPTRHAPPLPVVVVDHASVTFRQDGRPDLDLSGIDARLVPDSTGAGRLTASADEATWGRWDAEGTFSPGFHDGQIHLTGHGLVADPRRDVGLPFVPARVWQQVVARGPVGLGITIGLASGTSRPVRVRTALTLNGTELTLTALALRTTGTTGEVVVEDGLVRLNRVAGLALGGGIEADGLLDFTRPVPRFDLNVDLDRVYVDDAPATWHLDRVGVEGGRMSGQARLRMALDQDGVNLAGSSGVARIQSGRLQGIPFTSLRMVMRGVGDGVRFDQAGLSRRPPIDPALSRAGHEPTTSAPELPPPAENTVKLPRTFSTEIDLEDVELSRVVAKAEALGIKLPVEVVGRLSLKATAVIPLGTIRDVKAYDFHGLATLSGASIAGIDFGRASARVDLADGTLEVSDFQGQLVDNPEGGPGKRPDPTPPISADAPLPPGGFRGRARAELSPPGRFSGSFEADRLPLGELAAPVLPRPTPLSGRVSVDLKAEAAVDALRDPRAWSASGRVQSESVRYHDTTFDSVSARFRLDSGRLSLPEVSAKLEGRPLTADLQAELSAPYVFSGKVDVIDWSIGDLLALLPGVPRPAPADGSFTLRAVAKGSLEPFSVDTRGSGRLSRFRAGTLPLGDFPFRWTTGPDAVVVDGIETDLLGGRLSAHASVPTQPGRAAEGTITLLGLDTALLAGAMGDEHLALRGKADLRVCFAVPTARDAASAAVAAEVRVTAPDLTVQGVPTRGASGSLSVRKGVLSYEFLADSLDGTLKFRGDLPLASALSGTTPARAKLQAGWFSLGNLWKTEGVSGPLAGFEGLCAVGAHVQMAQDPALRWARGLGEVHGLRWKKVPVGNLRGVAAVTPAGWRVTPLTGDVLGGSVQGDLWGETRRPGIPLLGFNVHLDRFDLARLAALAPDRVHGHDFGGYASVRVEGTADKVKAEVRVEQGRVFDLPVADLRLPADWLYEAGSGLGTLSVRDASGRVAGGHVRGEARLRLGPSQDFHADLQLNGLDLRAFRKITPDERKPATGKLSGRVRLESPVTGEPRRLRGKAHLDLTDASLFELPVFRQINQFLGSEQGGIFEAGELDLTVSDAKIRLTKLALVGRLIQLRARGSIGFDGLLDLEVIVKPNQVIPQTGRALVTAVLGRGRRESGDDSTVLRTSNPLADGPVKLQISGHLADPKVVVDPSIHFQDDRP